MNNKGFVLIEILAVTVVIMVIFIAIYSNFLPTAGELEQRILYNDVRAEFASFYMRKLYLNEDIALNDNTYLVLYDKNECHYIKDELKDKCSKVAKELGIESLIVTTYNIKKLKNNYSGVLEDYINYLPEYKEGLTDEEFTIIPCSSETCQEKTFYRIRNTAEEEWQDYTDIPCVASELCEIKKMYQENKEPYRLILKIDSGYATTALKVASLDDKTAPICNLINKDLEDLDLITLECTDNNNFYLSDIVIADLTILINETNINVKTINKKEITNGFKYEIITDEMIWEEENTVVIELKENVLIDIFGNKNKKLMWTISNTNE